MICNYNELMDNLNSIQEDSWELAYNVDGIDDINDLMRMARILEKTNILEKNSSHMFRYIDLMEEIEGEKNQFFVQKAFKDFIDLDLNPAIESLLNVSRNWPFSDYRCRRFQIKLEEFALDAQSFISKLLQDN